jgi:hypothetical protein
LPKKADLAAEKNDSPLMRWAAHSARISEVDTPHSFSVYDLKKRLNRRLPKRFETHCSNVSSLPFGLIWAQK